MFEEILSENAISVIESLGTRLETFYLAGGTGLALQLGHRKSNDFDFFSNKAFNTDAMLSLISPDKVFFSSAGSLHCEIQGILISLLFYNAPLVHAPLTWRGVRLSHCEDIIAEKIKTISQRGAKKDFIDIYAAVKMKYAIPDICSFFKQRFKGFDINIYHVLKSLVFFEDAEKEPSPVMLLSGKEWEWDTIKSFFIENIELFEKELIQEFC